MKTKIKAILGEHDPHTPSILHFTTCTTGKCDTETNLNKGFYILKCSNEQCDFKAKPQPVNIDRWNIAPEYRNKVDKCPKCGNILYHTPKQSNISGINLKSSHTNQHNRGTQK